MEKLANENLMKLYLNECLSGANKLAMKSFPNFLGYTKFTPILCAQYNAMSN